MGRCTLRGAHLLCPNEHHISRWTGETLEYRCYRKSTALQTKDGDQHDCASHDDQVHDLLRVHGALPHGDQASRTPIFANTGLTVVHGFSESSQAPRVTAMIRVRRPPASGRCCARQIPKGRNGWSHLDGRGGKPPKRRIRAAVDQLHLRRSALAKCGGPENVEVIAGQTEVQARAAVSRIAPRRGKRPSLLRPSSVGRCCFGRRPHRRSLSRGLA